MSAQGGTACFSTLALTLFFFFSFLFVFLPFLSQTLFFGHPSAIQPSYLSLALVLILIIIIPSLKLGRQVGRFNLCSVSLQLKSLQFGSHLVAAVCAFSIMSVCLLKCGFQTTAAAAYFRVGFMNDDVIIFLNMSSFIYVKAILIVASSACILHTFLFM